jgi:hypothetical protein
VLEVGADEQGRADHGGQPECEEGTPLCGVVMMRGCGHCCSFVLEPASPDVEARIDRVCVAIVSSARHVGRGAALTGP